MIEVSFLGLLRMRALLFGVQNMAPDFANSHILLQGPNTIRIMVFKGLIPPHLELGRCNLPCMRISCTIYHMPYTHMDSISYYHIPYTKLGPVAPACNSLDVGLLLALPLPARGPLPAWRGSDCGSAEPRKARCRKRPQKKCMCIYIYIYIYIIYIHSKILVYIHMCRYIYMYMHIHVYAYAYTCIYT